MIELTMFAEELDVESRVRSARADVARLSLQIRTVEAEIERTERDAVEWLEATQLLRVSVAEALERRRAQFDADLADVRQQAEKVVADARTHAAALTAARRDVPRAHVDAGAPPLGGAPLTPEHLAQIVHAAVTTSLSQLAAAPQTLNAGRAGAQASARSRLLHLDVLLPLILVAIVVVVTLAWVS